MDWTSSYRSGLARVILVVACSGSGCGGEPLKVGRVGGESGTAGSAASRRPSTSEQAGDSGSGGPSSDACSPSDSGPEVDGADERDDETSEPSDACDVPESGPRDCGVGVGALRYGQGERRGRKFVHRSWKQEGGCCREEAFVDGALRRVEQVVDEMDGAACVASYCIGAGYVDGVLAALEEVAANCASDCTTRGERAGRRAVVNYCRAQQDSGGALSVDAWQREETLTCGFHYETGCDAAFVGRSMTVADQGGSCAAYMGEAYADVWMSFAYKACTY